MNAARALHAAGFDSDQVRETLRPIDPESVNLYPASSLLRSLWGKGVHGITLGRWVFIDPALLEDDPQRLGRLTLHELLHLKQISEMGVFGFVWRYLGDYARGRLRGLGHDAAYREIGVEREARRITAELSGTARPI